MKSKRSLRTNMSSAAGRKEKGGKEKWNLSPIFLFFFVFAFLPEQNAEKKLQTLLKEYFPSAKELRVNISAPFLKLAFGKINRVDIIAENPEFLGLRIKNLTLRVYNIHFSPLKSLVKSEFRVSSFKEGQAVFEIAQDDMEAYLRKRVSNKIKNLKLTFKKNAFVLEGNVDMYEGIILPSFRLEGNAVVKGGERIVLKIPKAKFTVLPIPAFLVDFIMEDINPVFNLRDAERELSIFKELQDFLGKPIRTELKSVSLEDGKVVCEAVGYPGKTQK